MPSSLHKAVLRQARRLNPRPCVGRLPPGRQRPYHIFVRLGGGGSERRRAGRYPSADSLQPL